MEYKRVLNYEGTSSWWKKQKKVLQGGIVNICCAIDTLESLKDITEDYERQDEYNDAIDFAVLILNDKIREIKNG